MSTRCVACNKGLNFKDFEVDKDEILCRFCVAEAMSDDDEEFKFNIHKERS